MEASITLWEQWQEQRGRLVAKSVQKRKRESVGVERAGHRALAARAVLPRMAERLYLQGISPAKMPRYSPAPSSVRGQRAY